MNRLNFFDAREIKELFELKPFAAQKPFSIPRWRGVSAPPRWGGLGLTLYKFNVRIQTLQSLHEQLFFLRRNVYYASLTMPHEESVDRSSGGTKKISVFFEFCNSTNVNGLCIQSTAFNHKLTAFYNIVGISEK
jgi:hypothetical protein